MTYREKILRVFPDTECDETGTPKKVKTYEDVYRERIKEAFPELDVNHVKPAYCRAQVFSEEVDCDGIYGDCKACWNQPYPEEEGGAE